MEYSDYINDDIGSDYYDDDENYESKMVYNIN